ncbi:hypothetical protein [Enterococcus hirae]|uniref:hypothetical protein n=1 Tax=Enterococcus hirae TaxID=1354 RepID=UPI002091B823|nr:hypothetical protein [Enterococcus hirae]MCO5510969.1 hypothetical protein [Enterococcus hirae]
MIAVSASILALLIPLAILLIENNGNVRDNSFIWDKMVVLTQVIDVKKTARGLIFITIPLVFWNIETIRSILLLVYCIGFYNMCILLKNSYYWIVSKYEDKEYYRNKKRFAYLDNLNNNQTTFDTWKLIWETDSQRMGLDEVKLIEKFFSCYHEFEKKDELLYLYFSNLNIDKENHDIISSFFYSEFARILEDMKNGNYRESSLAMMLQISYIEYMKQCYDNPYLVYSFIEGFNVFFGKSDKKILEIFFTNNMGTNMIEIIKNSKIMDNNFIKVRDYLPKSFKYEETELSKKEIILEIFSKWLSTIYKDSSSDIFVNNLFEVMFRKADPITFFRLIDFVLFVVNSSYGYNDIFSNKAKNILIEYSLEKNKFLTIGRTHVFWGNNDEKNLEHLTHIQNKEKEYSYKYLLNLTMRDFFIVQNCKVLDIFIESIDELVNTNDRTIQFDKYSLEVIKEDFINLKQLVKPD